MNTIITAATERGRDWITPEDVTEAIDRNLGDLDRVRLDLLEILGQQTRFGVEDAGLCAFLAWKGSGEDQYDGPVS